MHGNSLYSFIPRFKLVDRIEDGFANLNERRADLHRPPVPKRSNRDAASIASETSSGVRNLLSNVSLSVDGRQRGVAHLMDIEREASSLSAMSPEVTKACPSLVAHAVARTTMQR